jgi:hypothetical protein
MASSGTPIASAAAGRGSRVLAVVSARDPRLGRQRVVGGELEPPRGARHGAEAARDDRHVTRALLRERPELRRGVCVERAVTVDVVRLEVREHCDARSQGVDVLELERRQLADDPGTVVDGADEPAQRAPDVARNLDGPRGGLEHGTQECRRRRLPVRPRDPDERVHEQPRAELDLRDHRHVASPGRLHRRRSSRDAGALDDEADALEQRIVPTSRGARPGVDIGAVDRSPTRRGRRLRRPARRAR